MNQNVKEYICGYKHCLHPQQKITQSDAIKVGNRYYHKECNEIKTNIEKIRDLYFYNVSKTVVMSQLIKVINTIVFDKKVDSNYFLFALNYAIANKITIKSPYTLHYIIDNSHIKKQWTEKQNKRTLQDIKFDLSNISPQTHPSSSFSIKTKRNKGFGSILGG